MTPHPRVFSTLQREMVDWRLWTGRAVVLGFAVLAGLTVVGFTWLTEHALAYFARLNHFAWWLPLLWTPVCTAAIVWLTRRLAPGAAGSGIPQVMAAMTPGVPAPARALYVSLRISLAKMLLTTGSLLAGLSLGREGPSVQVAAGVMHHARRWLPKGSSVSDYGLLLAGGAAGIAAAFNTPLGGVMFAIEELARKPEQRSNGVVLAAIVLGGLMAVSVYGNATYFGVIRVENLGWALLLPGLLVALLTGAAGGLFARLVAVSLAGSSGDRFSRWRKQSPIWFAAGCGLVVAVLGCVSHGDAYGSGYEHTRNMLEGGNSDNSGMAALYVVFKFCATWITTWSGVPGGFFAPALSIGGALGNDVAQLTHYANAPTLIALGMVGFLAAVTQAPMTSFIIVMEMVNGHGLVLSLMASALIASAVSRMVSAPLYTALTHLQLQRLPEPLPVPPPHSAPHGGASHH